MVEQLAMHVVLSIVALGVLPRDLQQFPANTEPFEALVDYLWPFGILYILLNRYWPDRQYTPSNAKVKQVS